MGWFLSSGKKTTKKKKKASRGAGGSEWDPKRTLLGVKFAGAIGAVVLVAVGWAWLERGLVAYANTAHARPVAADDITFRQTPDWLTPAELNHMRTEIAELIGPGPMDRSGLKAAAAWLENQPQRIKTLRQVHRKADGTIDIDADFRRPAAVLRMFDRNEWAHAEDGYHVIDDAGFRLSGPPVALADIDHLGLPRILGVDSSYRPRDEQGEFQFQGNEVASALALIAALQDEHVLGIIEWISVNSRGPEGRIRLVLSVAVPLPGTTEPMSCKIVWGLPPGHPDAVIEANVSEKIRALNALVTSDAFRMGQCPESWINTGQIQFPPALAR